MKKLWEGEPVVIVAMLLFVVMLVQKIWLGEVITQEWVEWVLGIAGLATGAGILRNKVFAPDTVREIKQNAAIDYYTKGNTSGTTQGS